MHANQGPSKTTATFIALSLTIAAIALIGGPVGFFVYKANNTYKVPVGVDIVDVVRGKWVWEGRTCEEDAQTISFSADRTEMFIESARPFVGVDGVADSITSYRMLDILPDRVRGAIPGETRLTSAGEPAVWELVLQSPDQFAWHRTDWYATSLTKSNLRCH